MILTGTVWLRFLHIQVYMMDYLQKYHLQNSHTQQKVQINGIDFTVLPP